MSYYYLVDCEDGHSFINKTEEKLVPPYKRMPACVCVWDNGSFGPNNCLYEVEAYDIEDDYPFVRIREIDEDDAFVYLL